jgi:protein kinase-like protein/AAA ATPase-like protein
MPSERIQRRIDGFLDRAEAASDALEWAVVAETARAVLAIEATNEDAAAFLSMAVANGVAATAEATRPPTAVATAQPATSVEQAIAVVQQLETAEDTPDSDPTDFAGGRYRVLRFLGEGGKKRVFLAHDALLDRDIAFSLIKTEGLDDVGRERIMREAQAMGRLAHQNIVAIYDIGEHTASDGTKQPYLVQELMGGGDVEDLLKDAEGALPLQQSLDIALATARGLEFAHEAGVIHRDIKPGNVWLTADGVAKIGDLGLAVTIDQSRLTSHGMMVGTYGYMPPEQALGHEVTPQADLYSLGAMLYELVTGRPPFQGDTPTAVISQHLNTQPVAPSWNSDHCPPDLETLILGLLAKAPADRPATASDVIATLESVDPNARSTSHSDSAANPLDRLARGIFVGREQELERLRTSFDSALAGRGSVVMLVGEPGIGKTRAAQELETYARMRGAQVLWGRSHESSGAPAFWPWVQVGNDYAATNDLTQLIPAIGSASSDLLRIFPGMRALVPNIAEPEPISDPQAAQFRLFAAYTALMRAISSDAPLMIVLDDIHWADQPTLQLLLHLARELANMPLLVVCTYRDTELSRTHPLSEALAELNRGSGFGRIVLRGLTEEEVSAYICATANIDPRRTLVSRVYEETEGNPFFLSEVVRLMTEEGTLSSESVSDIAVPDGVREALGRRLDRLSEDANELLTVAAVVGREFGYEMMTLLSEHDEDELLSLIEEGLGALVIEEMGQAGRYRFTHALMQETLLGELSTTRRVRLHGRIGEALEERWGDRAAERPTRLAQHFAEAATLTSRHAEKAFRYSKLAAEAARAQASWSEAARYYQQCFTLLTESEVDLDEDVAGLLVALGVSARSASDFRTAWRSLMQAISLYRDKNDAKGQAAATIETLQMFVPAGRQLALIHEAVAALSGTEPQLEARLLSGLLASRTSDLSPEERAPILARARELQAAHQLEDVGARLGYHDAVVAWAAGQFDDAERGFADAHRAYDRLGMLAEAASALASQRHVPLVRGELDRAEQGLADALNYQRKAGITIARDSVLDMLASIALLRCDREQTDVLIQQVSEGDFAARLIGAQVTEMRGAPREALAELPVDTIVGGTVALTIYTAAAKTRLLLGAGEQERAQREFERCVALLPEFATDEAGSLQSPADWALLELGQSLVTLGNEPLLRAAYERLIASGCRTGAYGAHSVDQLLGQLALALDLTDEAEQHFRTGLEWCERERCPVEAARNRQGLANIAEEHGDLQKARAQLEAAGALFAEHGAKLYLDQVIAKKQILKA